MNKADNLPMSAEEFCKLHTAYHGELIDNIKQLTFQNFTGEELYEFCNFIAKETLYHHINVLAERIAEKGEVNYFMNSAGFEDAEIDKNSIREIAKDYINELNLESSK